MGHAPSSECCNHEPFVVDFESKGKGHERLAAIALTKANVTSLNSPFFQGLYAARCDESVRHWYCSTTDRTKINPAPSASFIFQKFVQEATEYVEATEDADPADFTPLPIALIKLPQDAVLFHPDNGQLLTTLELLGTNPAFEVVGYFGCRHFIGGGEVSPTIGTIGMFLSKTFNNEAKSVAILEIACRCYKHYMAMYGIVETPWPTEIHFDTLDSNMPCLRLMQKLLVSSQQQGISGDDELIVSHDLETERLKVIAKGSVVTKFAEHLAAQVTTADSITFSLKTRPVEPTPVSTVHSKLDEVIVLAKKKWTEANRPVVEAYTSAKIARNLGETSSAASSVVTRNSNIAPFPSTVRPVAPGTIDPTTPLDAPTPSTTLTRTSTSYRHSVYECQVLEEKHQEETELVQQCQQETASMYGGDQYSSYSPSVANTNYHQEVQAQVQYAEQQEVEEISALFLAKRTPISFWKKGRWSNAQWRDEAVVRLCAVQHAESDGLLAVELMYPNRTTVEIGPIGCTEISIFDEMNRPAKVRLDKPSIFYVPTNSLYHRDLSSKQYIPFSIGTEIAPADHQIEAPVSHHRPGTEEKNSYSNNVYEQEQRHAAY